MDNSTTTWIMVALLLLLIGAAIFVLLRRPGGGDDTVDSRDSSAVGDRDVVAEGRDLGPGTSAPGLDADRRASAADRRDVGDEPFDQHAVAPQPARDERVADEQVGDEQLGEGATAASYDTDVQGDDRHRDDAADTEETAYVVREDDHDPAPRHDPSVTGAQDPHAAQVEDTHAAPVQDTSYADVRPLSGDDIDDGARREPLPAEDTSVTAEPTRDEAGHLAEHGYHEDTTRARTAVPDETADPRTDAAEPVVDRDQDGAAYGAAGATAAGALAHDTDHRSTDTSASHADTVGTDDQASGTVGTDDRASGAGGAVFTQSAYGPGSAEPLEDGSGPEGWAVKGNTGSMLFHTQESPSYDAVRAEVWFESEEAARAAGFAHWDRRRR